jgi:hypothetical protein
VPAQTRISASWKNVDSIYTKIGGSWKNVEAAYTKVGGDWKQFFSSTVALTVNYLVIAGGGGGGPVIGGGGGAGGYRTSFGTSGGGASAESPLSLAIGTNYTVTIGAGGLGGISGFIYAEDGTNGSNSVFSGITSTGGGRGSTGNASVGGSGGGGGRNSATGGAGTTAQGFAGGTGGSNDSASAGGGGASQVGANGTTVSGSGGNGVASSITGTSVTRGGGGGGGFRNGSGFGVGGSGGGGTGTGSNDVAQSGTQNTGGGGGGAGFGSTWPSSNVRNGGNGGSGVVIIRYPNTYAITGGTGLTFTTATVGSDKVTTFTAGTGNIQFIEPTQDYQLLETVVLSSSQASVEFTNLATKYAADYQHLQIRAVVTSTRVNGDDDFRIRFNGDTGTNYAWHRLIGTGSTVISSGSSSLNRIFIGAINAANGTADSYSGLVVDILDPFETTKNKTVRSFGGQTNTSFVYLYSGLYMSTNSTTSIQLSCEGGNLAQYSRFSLYGLR